MAATPRRPRRQPFRMAQRGPERETLLALADLVAELMTLSDAQALIKRVCLGLCQTLALDAVLLWTYNPSSRRYGIAEIAVGTELIDEEDREALSGFQVRSGEGLAGRVVSEGIARSLPNVEAYRAAFGALGRRREALFNRLRSFLPGDCQILAMPLTAQDRPLGVIELVSGDRARLSGMVTWLPSYGTQIARLINLIEIQADARQQRRRLAALDSVVTAISTASDLPDLLQVTLLVMIEVVNARGGAICLVLPGSSGVSVAAQHHVPSSEMTLLTSSQAMLVLEDVIYYGQPTLRAALNVIDAEAQSSTLGRAAVPLLAGGTIVGVLLLYGPLEALEARVDWPTLVSVGSQIAIAIANTRLYEESQRERQRLGTVIASIADGVAICDRNGQLILANEAAAMILGLAALPTAEAHATDLFGDPVPAQEMPLARALRGEVFRDYRIVMPGPHNRPLVLSFSGAPLRGSSFDAAAMGDAPDGAVVVFRDITEQRRLDEAKDEFLAVAAHELRSPLSAIKGYSDLMLRRELKQGAASRDLKGHQILNQQVNVLMQLVDNLLDVSRIDAGRFELQSSEVDLTNLVEAVAIQVRSSAANHTVIVETPAEPVVVWGDALRLRQVITNLMTNAVRYSPVNTHVWVRVSADESAAHLLFDDEGPGIPPVQRDKLFGRYYRVPGIRRTGSSTEGLGLGLYLCREIVQMHDGTIMVESAPSGGARFHVTLPLRPPAAPQAAAGDFIDAALDRIIAGMALPARPSEEETP